MNETVKDFFDTVEEQITYKPVRKEACKELEAHIEDKTEEYMQAGMTEEMAVIQAVKEMGDAASVGVLLNETYRVQTDWRLLLFILLGAASGILSNLIDGYGIMDSSYFVFGLLILWGVTIYGYRFCVLHTKWCVAIAGLAMVFNGIYACAVAMFGVSVYEFEYCIRETMISLSGRLLNSMTLWFNGVYLMIPLCAVLLYKAQGKAKGWRGASASAILFLCAISGVAARPSLDYFIAAIVIVIVAYIILAVVALGKRKEVWIPLLAACIGIGVLVIGHGNIWRDKVELCFRPEVQATSRWNDGYNGVLIKELLSRAKFIGEPELTDEEWMNYGTGDWYFKNGEDADFMPIFRYEGEAPKLEDVLPQHYLNNYRVAYMILKYGWGIGMLFLALLAGLSGMLIFTAFRIKNRMGFLLAFGSSLVLALQTIFYVAGNFGYQFGSFVNLPFISEGTMSIFVNMILAGLVLSAYRYDRVIRECVVSGETS